MKHLLFSLVFIMVLVVGCAEKAKEKEEESSSEPTYAKVETPSEDPVKFPIYDYAEIEPLLYMDDEKTYVINFWATWCKPCLEELPYFEQVNAEQKDNNVEVILVSLDMPSMWKSRLEPYVEKKGLQSKVVILDDPKQNDWIPKIDQDWGGGIPATLIYNKSKREFYARGFTYEELNEELNKFIN